MAAALAAALVGAWITWSLPIGRALDPAPTPTLVLLTADGKPFARRGSYTEAPVRSESLPRYVPLAFVAIEDRRFFRHAGLDLRSIGRAALVNLRAGRVREGGSTITQQLAKNAFLSDERTYRRKAQEAVIALYLEARLSKAEILSRYLSKVYFGDGVFGLGAAAMHYFNKTPDKLTIGEAAMLAGLVKAPSRLAPTENLPAARARQAVVLRRMRSMGLISSAQATEAAEVQVRQRGEFPPVGSYFADWISPQAKRLFDRAYGEVEVRTTLDSRLQSRAEEIIRSVMSSQGARLNAQQAALVAMRPDGSIVAMVGGADYGKSQFNRAVQAERQPGSAFKLFVYAAAMRAGATPDSLVLDAPITVGGWTPQNHEEKYLGRLIPLREAFARSSNVAAVRLGQEVGLGRIEAAARDLGVTAALPQDATMALGTAQMSLLELTSAYASVLVGQAPVHPHGLAEAAPTSHPVDKAEQAQLLDLLRAVVTEGTGRTASAAGVDAFGKTGTSQDYRDAWFIGFAGDLVVGVWVGNDDNAPMRRVTGGMLPAQIWRDFVRYAGNIHAIGPGPKLPPIKPRGALEGLDPSWADTIQGEPVDIPDVEAGAVPAYESTPPEATAPVIALPGPQQQSYRPAPRQQEDFEPAAPPMERSYREPPRYRPPPTYDELYGEQPRYEYPQETGGQVDDGFSR